MLIGAVSMVSLPISQFPAVVPPEIRIQTTYVGADAQTLEQSVATPIEAQMSELPTTPLLLVALHSPHGAGVCHAL